MPINSDTDYEGGNLGHHIGIKKGYFPVPPLDYGTGHALGDAGRHGAHGRARSRSTTTRSASAQHELGLKFAPMVLMADQMQIYKYCIHQVAQIYGKTATFMPKPIYGDNGSGMHCHQSIWKDGKPTFGGNKYADLSDICLPYIGGILKHARTINAFTNPTTNSYKRLVPGFEAPVLLAYSVRNRSAGCRIPSPPPPRPSGWRCAIPTRSRNPYLGFAAMLMAGLDGIKNKIDPGPAIDKDLYDLPPAELKQIPTVCGSLRQALECLDADRDFLKAGGVFDDDFIDSYIDLKMRRGDPLRAHPASGRVRDVLFGVGFTSRRELRELRAPYSTPRWFAIEAQASPVGAGLVSDAAIISRASALDHASRRLARRRVVPSVAHFERIVVEVVELGPVGSLIEAEPVHVSVTSVRMRMRRSKPMYTRWPSSSMSTASRHDAPSVIAAQLRDAKHAVARRHAGAIEDGARDVDGAGESAAPAGDAPVGGLAPDEGHADQSLIVHRTLEHELMVAHQVAVVGGEDGDRVPRQAAVVERPQDARDRVVDHRDHAVGERDQRRASHARCRQTAPACPCVRFRCRARRTDDARAAARCRARRASLPAAACRRRGRGPNTFPAA